VFYSVFWKSGHSLVPIKTREHTSTIHIDRLREKERASDEWHFIIIIILIIVITIPCPHPQQYRRFSHSTVSLTRDVSSSSPLSPPVLTPQQYRQFSPVQ
jgi:hypothetical protein